MENAKSFLLHELDRRATDAGERMVATADRLRAAATDLRGDDLTRGSATFAERGAETLERLGRYLQESDAQRLVTDAETFGRERPWALVASGTALGLAASRLLKASSARRYRGEGALEERLETAYESEHEAAAASAGATTGAPDAVLPPAGEPISSDAAPLEALANSKPRARKASAAQAAARIGGSADGT